MKLALGFSSVKWRLSPRWFTWMGAARQQEGTDHHVRFEDLSPHILRDLGLSQQHARDLMAEERTRFLA